MAEVWKAQTSIGAVSIHYRCFVPGCPNSAENDHQLGIQRDYIPFPDQNSQLFTDWLEVIGHGNHKPQLWHKVCSSHFAEDVMNMAESIPSIFPWTQLTETQSTEPSEPMDWMEKGEDQPVEPMLNEMVMQNLPRLEIQSVLAEQTHIDAMVGNSIQPVPSLSLNEGIIIPEVNQSLGESILLQCEPRERMMSSADQHEAGGITQTIFLTADGQIVNSDGQIVNSDGQIVNSDGQIVNSDGQIVNSDGQIVNSDGQIVNSDDQIINSDGQIENSDGQIYHSDDHIQQEGFTESNVIVEHIEQNIPTESSAAIFLSNGQSIFDVSDRSVPVEAPHQGFSSEFSSHLIISEIHSGSGETIFLQPTQNHNHLSAADVEQKTQENLEGFHLSQERETENLDRDLLFQEGETEVLVEPCEDPVHDDNIMLSETSVQPNTMENVQILVKEGKPEYLLKAALESTQFAEYNEDLQSNGVKLNINTDVGELCEPVTDQSPMESQSAESDGRSEADEQKSPTKSVNALNTRTEMSTDEKICVCVVCDKVTIMRHLDGKFMVTRHISTLSQAKVMFPNLVNIDRHVCHKCEKMIADVRAKQGKKKMFDRQPVSKVTSSEGCDNVDDAFVYEDDDRDEDYVPDKDPDFHVDDEYDMDDLDDYKVSRTNTTPAHQDGAENPNMSPDFLSLFDLVPQGEIKTKVTEKKRPVRMKSTPNWLNLRQAESATSITPNKVTEAKPSPKKEVKDEIKPVMNMATKVKIPMTRKSQNQKAATTKSVPFDPNGYVCVGCNKKMERYKRGYARWTLNIVADLETVKSVFPHLDDNNGYICYSCHRSIEKAKEGKFTEMKAPTNKCVCCFRNFHTYKNKRRLCRWPLEHVCDETTAKRNFPHLKSTAGYCCTTCKTKLYSECHPELVEMANNCVVCKVKFQVYSKSNRRFKLESCGTPDELKATFPHLKEKTGFMCHVCKKMVSKPQKAESLNRTEDNASKRENTASDHDEPVHKKRKFFGAEPEEIVTKKQIQHDCTCVACLKIITDKTESGALIRWRIENIAHYSTIEELFPNIKRGTEGFVCRTCTKSIVKLQKDQMDSVVVPAHTVLQQSVIKDSNCVCCAERFKRNSRGFIRWFLGRIVPPALIKETFPHLRGLGGYACSACKSMLKKSENPEKQEVKDEARDMDDLPSVSNSFTKKLSDSAPSKRGKNKNTTAKPDDSIDTEKSGNSSSNKSKLDIDTEEKSDNSSSNKSRLSIGTEKFSNSSSNKLKLTFDTEAKSGNSSSKKLKLSIGTEEKSDNSSSKKRKLSEYFTPSAQALTIAAKVSEPELCIICKKNLRYEEKTFHLKRVSALHRLQLVYPQLTNRNGKFCVSCHKLFKNKIKPIPSDCILSVNHVGHKEDVFSQVALLGMEHSYCMYDQALVTNVVPIDMEMDADSAQMQQIDSLPCIADHNSSVTNLMQHESTDRKPVELFAENSNSFKRVTEEAIIPGIAKSQFSIKHRSDPGNRSQTLSPSHVDPSTGNVVFIPGKVGESSGVLFRYVEETPRSDMSKAHIAKQILMNASKKITAVANDILQPKSAPTVATQVEIQSRKIASEAPTESPSKAEADQETNAASLRPSKPTKQSFSSQPMPSGGPNEGNSNKKVSMGKLPGKKRSKRPNLSLSELDYTSYKVRWHIKQNDITNMFLWLYSLDNGRLRKGFLNAAKKIIKKELKGKKKVLKSLTGQCEPKNVSDFSWKEVVNEANSQAPLLSAAVDAVFPPEEVKSPRFSKLDNVYEARKGMVLSILYNSVAPQCNLAQNIIGLELWKTGASKKVFNMLDILGVGPDVAKYSQNNKICRNFHTATKLKFESWKAEAEASATNNGAKAPLYSLVWGKVDLDLAATSTADPPPPMTCLYAVRHRIKPPHVPEKTDTVQAIDLHPETFLASDDDWYEYRASMIRMVVRILIRYMAVYSELDEQMYTHTHKYSTEMTQKSEVISLGVILQDTSTNEGGLAVADALQSYCGVSEGSTLPILCGGDSGSVTVIQDVQLQRSQEDSAVRRLEGLVQIPQETHREKVLLQDTYNELYDTSNSVTRGTLSNIQSFLKMAALADVNQDYLNSRNLLQISTEAFIVLMGMKFLSLDTKEGFPQKGLDMTDQKLLTNHLEYVATHIVEECWYQTPPEEVRRVFDFLAAKGDEKLPEYTYCLCKQDKKDAAKVRCSNVSCPYQWFHYKCLRVRPKEVDNWYCSKDCRYVGEKPGKFIYCWCRYDTGQQMIQCERQDQCSRYQWYHITCEGLDPLHPPEVWYCSEQCMLNQDNDDPMTQYCQHLLWRGLCHLVDREGVRAGDGPTMLRNWKISMIHLWNKQELDLMRSAHALLANVGGFASPRLMHELTWERVANLYGEESDNVGLDTVCHTFNTEFQDVVSQKERFKSAQNMDMSAKVSGDLSMQTERLLHRKSSFRSYHDTPRVVIEKLVKAVIDEYSGDKLFNYRSERVVTNVPQFSNHVRQPRKLAARIRGMCQDLDQLNDLIQESRDFENQNIE